MDRRTKEATMRFQGRRLYPLALFAWLATQPLMAQVDRADLNGTVTDPSGAVIVGAKVDAISVATGKEREVLTNGQGIYVIPALPAGTYTFTFSRDGFETARF